MASSEAAEAPRRVVRVGIVTSNWVKTEYVAKYGITVKEDDELGDALNQLWWKPAEPKPEVSLRQGDTADQGAWHAVESQVVAWDDEQVSWSSFDCLVIRSAWDYHNAWPAWQAWVQRVREQVPVVCNSPEILGWNGDKVYLRDLEQQGVRIVPTYWFHAADAATASVRTAMTALGAGRVVMKPSISASADGCVVVGGDPDTKLWLEEAAADAELRRCLATGATMLVQPFLRCVASPGELSLVYAGGQYLHALRKVAATGDFRVQHEFGGSILPVTATAAEKAFAQEALEGVKRVLGTYPVYARVDLMQADDDEHCLLLSELEMIEPELYLRVHPDPAQGTMQVARAVLEQVTRLSDHV